MATEERATETEAAGTDSRGKMTYITFYPAIASGKCQTSFGVSLEWAIADVTTRASRLFTDFSFSLPLSFLPLVFMAVFVLLFQQQFYDGMARSGNFA
jgi:ABC-type sulfate transport system permease subunit